ncbi:hypothetical protein CYLTODRAFT_361928 [Cylindrobasidium torrendii FP15055 ss-10]|uniref:Centrosomin N-terminal motif 1 domain-containing protein n=1 Tax=Cylindrobasidium torrendii FP15055 ss-10 TaxID=1314674 RepID=A0A0D7AUU0_9AGAR|nr:hypothetical protein CYLTODRAFT_361928 [Cylindrobasidium torrendii FP15055 ss-10]
MASRTPNGQEKSVGFDAPDLSLGSVDSNFSPPRLPSNTSINVLTTPNPSVRHASRRGTVTASNYFDETDVDFLETPPAGNKSNWDASAIDSPTALRAKGRQSGNNALTLRDQEKHIDHLKKENFDLKLKVHFLEERLSQLAPDHLEGVLKQNIDMKIEMAARGTEVKKYKKTIADLEAQLERLQRGAGSSKSRERELEEKLQEREREIRELRGRQQNGYDRDERERELEDQLEDARELLEDNNAEIERLRDVVERGQLEKGTNPLRKRIEELEDINLQWQDKVQELAEEHEAEKNELLDSIDALGVKLERLQDRNASELQERSQSRAMIMEEREHREDIEDELHETKDRLAAALIELQQKEDEVDVKNEELQDIMKQHENIVQQWRDEVEESRQQVDELRDVLAERDAESKELRLQIAELEANTDDLHGKFETALAHLEKEAEEKETEIESLTEAIKELSEHVYQAEDERDRIREEAERQRDEDDSERERLEGVANALREKVAGLKDELQEMADSYDAATREIEASRNKQEELAQHIENLVDEIEQEREGRTRAEQDLDAADQRYDADMRRERRSLEAKESALQSALTDLARTQSLLTQRDADLQAVQSSLQAMEAESKKAGETHSTARFSLQLEVDRLKRDLERVEDELARARRDLNDKENKGRDRDGDLDKIHAENRDLASQLAAQTQARLNISEKLDAVQASLKAAEAETATFKARVSDLEGRLGKDQRALLNAENQYRDQLTERNTLLLTIYQYMDKILGVDKTPKKAGQAETKPFTNFSVFHDNLITRLKSLSHISSEFERRCKEAEGNYTEKLNEMRKQIDSRWKQVDKFEASVKAYADTKTQWRRKFAQKDGEIDSLRTANQEMATQLSGMKRPGHADPMELRSLSTRAVNAERRLNHAQNQLSTTEEKLAQLSKKSLAADTKWEARVKEYETRLKAAEERVKRERQAGKDRVSELENSIKIMQKQLEVTHRRASQLDDVIETNKVVERSPRPSR